MPARLGAAHRRPPRPAPGEEVGLNASTIRAVTSSRIRLWLGIWVVLRCPVLIRPNRSADLLVKIDLGGGSPLSRGFAGRSAAGLKSPMRRDVYRRLASKSPVRANVRGARLGRFAALDGAGGAAADAAPVGEAGLGGLWSCHSRILPGCPSRRGRERGSLGGWRAPRSRFPDGFSGLCLTRW